VTFTLEASSGAGPSTSEVDDLVSLVANATGLPTSAIKNLAVVVSTGRRRRRRRLSTKPLSPQNEQGQKVQQQQEQQQQVKQQQQRQLAAFNWAVSFDLVASLATAAAAAVAPLSSPSDFATQVSSDLSSPSFASAVVTAIPSVSAFVTGSVVAVPITRAPSPTPTLQPSYSVAAPTNSPSLTLEKKAAKNDSDEWSAALISAVVIAGLTFLFFVKMVWCKYYYNLVHYIILVECEAMKCHFPLCLVSFLIITF
jgi:hypothetical protein